MSVWTPELEEWWDADLRAQREYRELARRAREDVVAGIIAAHESAVGRLRAGFVGALIGGAVVGALVSVTTDASWWRFAAALALGAVGVMVGNKPQRG